MIDELRVCFHSDWLLSFIFVEVEAPDAFITLWEQIGEQVGWVDTEKASPDRDALRQLGVRALSREDAMLMVCCAVAALVNALDGYALLQPAGWLDPARWFDAPDRWVNGWMNWWAPAYYLAGTTGCTLAGVGLWRGSRWARPLVAILLLVSLLIRSSAPDNSWTIRAVFLCLLALLLAFKSRRRFRVSANTNRSPT